MTRVASLAAALAAVLLMSGCTGGAVDGPQPDPAASATPEPPGVRVTRPVWATRTGGGADVQLLAAGEEAVVVGRQLAGTGSSLEVLDATTGRRVWTLRGDDLDRGRTRRSYVELGAEVGPDGTGGEIVVVPYQAYTCASAASTLETCRVRPGLEARDARSGEVRWRWDSPRRGKASSIVLGLLPTEEAVLLEDDERLVALDPVSGEPRWVSGAPLPLAVGDGLAVTGPDPGEEGPYRMLDLRTGDVVRTVATDDAPDGFAGDVLAVPDGDEVRLEDARSGRVLGSFDDGTTVRPLPVRADGALAWRGAGDRLLTLLPGETEPVETVVPDELGSANTATAYFAGAVAGGAWVLLADGVVRTMSRAGAADPQEGPRAVVVRSVSDRTLVLQVGTEPRGPEPAAEVRQIR